MYPSNSDSLCKTEQAARAQLEGRVEDAEALCQLAYESYRLNFFFWEFYPPLTKVEYMKGRMS